MSRDVYQILRSRRWAACPKTVDQSAVSSPVLIPKYPPQLDNNKQKCHKMPHHATNLQKCPPCRGPLCGESSIRLTGEVPERRVPLCALHALCGKSLCQGRDAVAGAPTPARTSAPAGLPAPRRCRCRRESPPSRSAAQRTARECDSPRRPSARSGCRRRREC